MGFVRKDVCFLKILSSVRFGDFGVMIKFELLRDDFQFTHM